MRDDRASAARVAAELERLRGWRVRAGGEGGIGAEVDAGLAGVRRMTRREERAARGWAEVAGGERWSGRVKVEGVRGTAVVVRASDAVTRAVLMAWLRAGGEARAARACGVVRVKVV